MTWQEELRQLDSALAGGELSANEYRKRRDEILAAASSAQPPSPVLGAPSGPPPAAAEAAGGGDNAEVTQVVNIEAAEADQTQIIDSATAGGDQSTGNNSNNGNGNGNGESNGERTQVTTVPAPQSQQAPQQPVWTTQLPDPHAATGAFPHQQAAPSFPGPAVTPHDAQDLFTSNKAPRGTRKPWLIGVLVLVVLALAGGAVWFFGTGDDDGTQNTAETPGTSSAPAPEPVDITKIELPGKAGENSGAMNISQASELNVVAPAEAALIADAGAESLVYSGSTDGAYRFMLYSYESGDQQTAEKLTGEFLDIQERLGYEGTEVGEVPDSVHTTIATNDKAAAMRGVYTYGNTTIQLSVLQIPVGSADELRVQFQKAMTAVLDAAPPAG